MRSRSANSVLRHAELLAHLLWLHDAREARLGGPKADENQSKPP